MRKIIVIVIVSLVALLLIGYFYRPLLIRVPLALGGDKEKAVIAIAYSDRSHGAYSPFGKASCVITNDLTTISRIKKILEDCNGEGDLVTCESVLVLSNYDMEVSIAFEPNGVVLQSRKTGCIYLRDEMMVSRLISSFRPYYFPIIFINR